MVKPLSWDLTKSYHKTLFWDFGTMSRWALPNSSYNRMKYLINGFIFWKLYYYTGALCNSPGFPPWDWAIRWATFSWYKSAPLFKASLQQFWTFKLQVSLLSDWGQACLWKQTIDRVDCWASIFWTGEKAEKPKPKEDVHVLRTRNSCNSTGVIPATDPVGEPFPWLWSASSKYSISRTNPYYSDEAGYPQKDCCNRSVADSFHCLAYSSESLMIGEDIEDMELLHIIWEGVQCLPQALHMTLRTE